MVGQWCVRVHRLVEPTAALGGQGDCHLCGPGLLLLGHLGQGDVGWEIFHVGRECMPTSVFFKGPHVFRMLSVSYGCVCVLCVCEKVSTDNWELAMSGGKWWPWPWS